MWTSEEAQKKLIEYLATICVEQLPILPDSSRFNNDDISIYMHRG